MTDEKLTEIKSLKRRMEYIEEAISKIEKASSMQVVLCDNRSNRSNICNSDIVRELLQTKIDEFCRVNLHYTLVGKLEELKREFESL